MSIDISFNAIRGFPRWTELATFASGGGSWEPVFPVTDLGIEPLARVARSTSADRLDTRFLCSLDKTRGVRLLAICRHNISLAGEQRIALSSGPACDFTVNTTSNVVTAAGHDLEAGSAVVLWTTVEDLPLTSPVLVEGDVYYAGTISASTFKLYPTEADAVAETNAIDFVDAGSGTHTVLGPVVYRSDWEMTWLRVYEDHELEWEDDNWWTAQYTAEELADSTWTRPVWLDILYSARAAWVEVDDEDNEDDFVQIGLFDVSQGWQTTIGHAYGAQWGWEFRTKERVAWGGVASHERLPKPRVVRGSIKNLTRDEALAKWGELLRQHDLDRAFFYLPRPLKPKHWLREAFLAKNLDPGLAAQAYVGRDDVPFAHKEVL